MNYVDIELDAYEIAGKIFSENSELDRNFCFENVDVKTFFDVSTVFDLKLFWSSKHFLRPNLF